MKLSLRLTLVVAAVALSLSGGIARAQDHEKCYKIKDPVKLSGTLDLTTPQFGLEPGCVVGPAKYFCAPASKSNVAVIDKATDLPIVPLLFNAPPATVDRICYKIKCPVPPPPFPPDQNVTDQFGNRTLTKFKAAFMCTPAGKGPGYCGNTVIDPGEECDDGNSIDTDMCRNDCTFPCQRFCCRSIPSPGACFEVYSVSPPICFGIADCNDLACLGMGFGNYARYVDSGCGW